MAAHVEFNNRVPCWISIFLLIITSSPHHIQHTTSADVRLLSAKPKGTLKTIKAEDGDVIDCVDIYKQPSLDHPLLKNHKIQMKPTSYPIGLNRASNASSVYQSWSKAGECPDGTIPIRRPFQDESNLPNLQESVASAPLNNSNNFPFIQKISGVCISHTEQDMFGVSAHINLWNPITEAYDMSMSRIGLMYNEGQRVFNSLGTGWIVNSPVTLVNPQKFGDRLTRFIIYFQNEKYPFLCFNLDCPGFVQVSRKVALGAAIKPTSTLGGPQFEIHSRTFQDPATKMWWLHFGEVELGYWPALLVRRLSGGATYAYWVGEVAQDGALDRPTTTQMGSGHYAAEGFRQASYMSMMTVVNIFNTEISPEPREVEYAQTVDKGCYSHSNIVQSARDGSLFFYGGPGRCAFCWKS